MAEDEFALPHGATGAVGCIVFVLAGVVAAPISMVTLAYAKGGGWRLLVGVRAQSPGSGRW